jgi:mannose-6-phosphate isomerase-like protein (cupin superfamily)
MAPQPHLPWRAWPRPLTSSSLPRCQLDQQPGGRSYADDILARVSTWPHVPPQPSKISVEGARALSLGVGTADGPAEPFICGDEFCHVHAQDDFGLHATLPLPLAAVAEERGWAEPDFLVKSGPAPATVVMLYAPRNQPERDVVLGLVRVSYEFALGQDGRRIADGDDDQLAENARPGKGAAMPIHVVRPYDGERSGGGPVRCRIIEDGSHTQHRLGLIEAVVPPGPVGPQHVHNDHDGIFIVTEGNLRFTSRAQSVDAGAGSCVTVPAGTPPTFADPFAGPARLVGTLTPTCTRGTSATLAGSPSTNGAGSTRPTSAGPWASRPPKWPTPRPVL